MLIIVSAGCLVAVIDLVLKLYMCVWVCVCRGVCMCVGGVMAVTLSLMWAGGSPSSVPGTSCYLKLYGRGGFP